MQNVKVIVGILLLLYMLRSNLRHHRYTQPVNHNLGSVLLL